MVFPYEELKSIRKQSDTNYEYLDQLATIGSYALDDLETSVDDAAIKESLRELNIAITGLAEYLVEQEAEN